MGAGQADSNHPHWVLWFYMQITSELLPKSFLCSCAAKVQQMRAEISHPPIAGSIWDLQCWWQERAEGGTEVLLSLSGWPDKGWLPSGFFSAGVLQCRAKLSSGYVSAEPGSVACLSACCSQTTGYIQWALYGVYSSTHFAALSCIWKWTAKIWNFFRVLFYWYDNCKVLIWLF